jgi:hypothetical protein
VSLAAQVCTLPILTKTKTSEFPVSIIFASDGMKTKFTNHRSLFTHTFRVLRILNQIISTASLYCSLLRQYRKAIPKIAKPVFEHIFDLYYNCANAAFWRIFAVQQVPPWRDCVEKLQKRELYSIRMKYPANAEKIVTPLTQIGRC